MTPSILEEEPRPLIEIDDDRAEQEFRRVLPSYSRTNRPAQGKPEHGAIGKPQYKYCLFFNILHRRPW